MSKILANTIGVAKHSDKTNHYSHTSDNIIKSIFHTILIPLGLALALPLAGLVYFTIMIIAYSTIFRDKSYYVFLIMKFVGALAAVAIAWVSMFYVIGHIGAMI
jgi:uncharacterized membrane protein